jgi:hypothetical protein
LITKLERLGGKPNKFARQQQETKYGLMGWRLVRNNLQNICTLRSFQESDSGKILKIKGITTNPEITKNINAQITIRKKSFVKVKENNSNNCEAS